MLAPAPSPNLLPFRITPASGVVACAFAIAAVTACKSVTAACESVFIPPESKVTQAVPFRMSCWKRPIGIIPR